MSEKVLAHIKLNDKLGLALNLVALLAIIATLVGGWTLQGARLTALEVADVAFQARDLRIEEAQRGTHEVAIENQRSLAAIEAKIDILLSDRRNAP